MPGIQMGGVEKSTKLLMLSSLLTTKSSGTMPAPGKTGRQPAALAAAAIARVAGTWTSPCLPDTGAPEAACWSSNIGEGHRRLRLGRCRMGLPFDILTAVKAPRQPPAGSSLSRPAPNGGRPASRTYLIFCGAARSGGLRRLHHAGRLGTFRSPPSATSWLAAAPIQTSSY
jgi:hypothetical protein